MIVLEFTRDEYREIVAPILNSMESTDYVSYYPEKPVVIFESSESATYLRLVTQVRGIKSLEGYLSDKKDRN